MDDDSIECPTEYCAFFGHVDWNPLEEFGGTPSTTASESERVQERSGAKQDFAGDSDHQSIADKWIREPGCWVRLHKRPRRAMFTPLGTYSGPPVAGLSVYRVTVAEFSDGSSELINDMWCGLNGRRL